MARCTKYLRDHNYSERCISNYESLWKSGIIRHLQSQGTCWYTVEAGEEYASTCHHDGRMTAQDQKKVRSVTVLTEFLLTGEITRGKGPKTLPEIFDKWRIPAEEVIDYQRKMRRSARTLMRYGDILKSFTTYMNDCGLSNPDEIHESHIVHYISTITNCKDELLAVLRTSFRIWKESGLSRTDHADLLHSIKVDIHKKLPSVYSKTEVLKVESSIDRSSAVGKRNYAMVLLASRLGLRASDIAALRLDDIDWNRNVINICMQKTDKEIELPLLVAVGDAIIDYLKNGRPRSECRQIFLSCRAPFRPLEKGSSGSAVSRAMVASGIKTEGKHHGPHSLRHSLATAMLSNGESMPVISEALGHRSTEATMAYISVDMSTMKRCALDVPSVDEAFYNQRGGAFYE